MGTKSKLIIITAERLLKRSGDIRCAYPACATQLKMGDKAYITSGGRILCSRCFYTRRMRERAKKDLLGRKKQALKLVHVANYF